MRGVQKQCDQRLTNTDHGLCLRDGVPFHRTWGLDLKYSKNLLGDNENNNLLVCAQPPVAALCTCI